MLDQVHFLPAYFKTRNELYEEFYRPCMENAVFYDRISGYFGSSIFLVIHDALKTFIKNEGQIRIICSPVLNDDDIKSLLNGYDQRLEQIVSANLNEALEELSKTSINAAFLLSKMISAKVLDIKLAVFGDNPQANRLMHDKAGLFTDANGNSVAFRGSINETFKGVSVYGNSESFDVFTTWENGKDKQRVDIISQQFNNMWAGTEPNIRTLDVPEQTFEKIKSYITPKTLDELISEITPIIPTKKLKWFAETGEGKRNIKRHQEAVLNNWETNGRKGLFEMCTGSGKTFSALCAIRDAVSNRNEVPVIIVPSKLLFEQWEKELKKVFSETLALLKIGDGHRLDAAKLKTYTRKDISNARCILAIYQSANKELFLKSVNWGNHIFLVCDEVHNIGSEQNSRLLNIYVGARLGLSATPKRYFDEEGTKKIIDFFGGIIQPTYQIANAIADEVLCPYFYNISEVELKPYEQEKWNQVTKEINKRIAMKKSTEELKNIKGLEKLLFERADIVKKAQEKIRVAEEILFKHYREGERWLVYLDDTSQVNELHNTLNKYSNLKGNVFEYHTNTENDLPQTIQYFEKNGAILLSINCLDEGVDIPSIDHAIILASSKNPRQYIQRRGRVLRTSPGKTFAYIYDCLVSPNSLVEDSQKNLSIIKGEIARALSFSKNAKNEGVVRNQIQIIMNNNCIEIEEGEYGENE